jgi:hypothetical protein
MCSPPANESSRILGSRSDVRPVQVVSRVDEQLPMSGRARVKRPVSPVERILYTREEAATALGDEY